MNLTASNFGECGNVQAFYVGSVAFDTTDIGTGVAIFEAPAAMVITEVCVDVTAAFNAGTTNVLTIGTNSDVDNICGSSDIAETKGSSAKATFARLAKGDKVKVKYASTGTAASAGAADIFFVGTQIPA